MTNQVHIGEIIQGKLREKERSVTWFAKKLCCVRPNVYKIFRKESLDSSLLLRISIILDEDFFHYYSNALIKTEKTTD